MIAAAPYFLAVAVLVSGMAYVKGRHDGNALSVAEDVRDQRVAVIAAESAASAAAGVVRQIRVQHTTIQQKVEREIQTRVEYRDCRHAPGVLDGINEALTGKRPEPAAGGGVPAVDAAGR